MHKDLYEFAIPQLTTETRFADLMIIGSETFYKSENATGLMAKTDEADPSYAY